MEAFFKNVRSRGGGIGQRCGRLRETFSRKRRYLLAKGFLEGAGVFVR